jgi:putative transposase
MVECMNPALPISQQCRLLALPRSSVYRSPAAVDAEDLAIMALIDRHYLDRPYYGSRRMAAWLATQGHHVNRKRVQRLMRLLGLAAIYQRPNTSKPATAHKIYPYLLRGLTIERVNQVWCSDITYIPMAKGFLYLVVIMDWVSRAVLAWVLRGKQDEKTYCLTGECSRDVKRCLTKRAPVASLILRPSRSSFSDL